MALKTNEKQPTDTIKRMKFRLSPDGLIMLLNLSADHRFWRVQGLPAGCQVVSVFKDERSDDFWIYVTHDSFEAIGVCEPVPELFSYVEVLTPKYQIPGYLLAVAKRSPRSKFWNGEAFVTFGNEWVIVNDVKKDRRIIAKIYDIPCKEDEL